MAGINLSVHPLFFVLGFFYALKGEILIFIICTATAVIHELGHSFVSASLGYRLNKITLMPFGAVVSGNIEGLKFHDQIKIAFAGPLINLAISLFFVALWWIYPECYAYTDVIVSSNISMALINLLPIYPLDGGRIVFSCLANKVGYNKAFTICKVLGGGFSLMLLGWFILGLSNKVFNFSLMFFALFVCFGTFSRERENKYVKIFACSSSENLKRGMLVVRHAVDKDITIKRLLLLLDERAINEVEVFDGDKKIAMLNQKQIEEIIKTANIYTKLSQSL